MHSRLSMRVALAMTLALAAACGDDDDPTSPGIGPEDIATQCLRGTFDDVTTTEFFAGTINGDDCRLSGDDEGGLLEAYSLPQSAFGDMTEVQIDLESDFDGWILILDQQGNFVTGMDENFAGSERLILPFDEDPSEPDYLVVVYSFDGDDSGSYSLSVGPVDGGV